MRPAQPARESVRLALTADGLWTVISEGRDGIPGPRDDIGPDVWVPVGTWLVGRTPRDWLPYNAPNGISPVQDNQIRHKRFRPSRLGPLVAFYGYGFWTWFRLPVAMIIRRRSSVWRHRNSLGIVAARASAVLLLRHSAPPSLVAQLGRAPRACVTR